MISPKPSTRTLRILETLVSPLSQPPIQTQSPSFFKYLFMVTTDQFQDPPRFKEKKNGKDKGFSVYENWAHYQMQSYPPGPQASLQEWRSVRATAHYRCTTEETKKL